MGHRKLDLLYQEMIAEKQISIIRIVINTLLLLFSIIGRFKVIIPFLITFFVSIGFNREITYMLKSNKFKKIQIIYKYIVILVDLTIFSNGILYASKGLFIFTGDFTEVSFVFLLTFLVIILLFADILRFSLITSFYIGILGIVFVTIFSSKFITGNFFNIKPFFYSYLNIGAITLILISSVISAAVSSVFHSLMEKSRKQEDLERFLPAHVAKEVLESGGDIEVGGKKKKVTILFSDIRDFTSISEKESPEDVIDFLNIYFNDMIETIFKHNGTLDKIVGDGIMAIFGAAGESSNWDEKALLTALDMRKKLDEFNKIRILQGHSEIEIGIGIHSGDVILGNIGTAKRMEFTAIGDSVNIASRLQDLTKRERYKIILSKDVYENIPKKYKLFHLGNVLLKGKEKAVDIYGI